MSNSAENQINTDLAAFARDPKAFMNRQPPKFDANGNPIAGHTVFTASDIANQEYITAHDQQRVDIIQPEQDHTGAASTHTRAAIASNDKPENLVDSFKYNKLDAMEAAGLTKATLAESPWSDDYWGIYKGILGARYADPNFPASADWKQNYDYIRANPSATILASGNAKKINALSPSEKYDALVGDTNESLTKALWAEGKSYYDANGSVETWMGICHGWAPVAYMLARPTKSVTLKTPNNVAIKFYPSDIKALGSLLWANAASSTKFIGGRCNVSNPPTDTATGRITAADCFDTNPGTWHLAMVNQIGASKRSMVMDVTFDYEVWNQPVYSYQYRYFNPQTMLYSSTIAGATVAASAYTNDKFRKYRSPQAKAMVGVQMTVAYVVETQPSQNETDSPSRDAIQQAVYYYDLELDANNVIIGGEWYTNKHPDFLWTPAKGQRAVTRYDAQATGTWNAASSIPSTWRTAAKSASTNQSAPLATIVENLIKFANSGVSLASEAPAPAAATSTSTPATSNPATPTNPVSNSSSSTPSPSTNTTTTTSTPNTTASTSNTSSGGSSTTTSSTTSGTTTTNPSTTTSSTTTSSTSTSTPWWRRIFGGLLGG